MFWGNGAFLNVLVSSRIFFFVRGLVLSVSDFRKPFEL